MPRSGSPVRPVFRVLAAIIAVLSCGLGIAFTIERSLSERGWRLDGGIVQINFELLPVYWIAFGLMMLRTAIRGRS